MIEPDFEKVKNSIVKMSNDISSLEEKYGSNTKWVVEKRMVLQNIINFHDECADFKNQNDNLIQLMHTNYETLKVILMKYEFDLPWRKVFKSMGMKQPTTFELLEQITSLLSTAHEFSEGKHLLKFLSEILNKQDEKS